MRLPLMSERPPAPACPDCPSARLGLFDGLVGTVQRACAFQCISLEERASASPLWYERYAFAIVRRGVFVRERIDRNGARTAIDVVGPGGMVPLRVGSAAASGYAASRALLCVYPDARFAVDPERPSVALDLVRLQQRMIERIERIAEARGLSLVPDRIAALLDVLEEHVTPRAAGERLPSGIQQRDLAALLQLRPETVCRALRTLDRPERVPEADADAPATPAPRTRVRAAS